MDYHFWALGCGKYGAACRDCQRAGQGEGNTDFSGSSAVHASAFACIVHCAVLRAPTRTANEI